MTKEPKILKKGKKFHKEIQDNWEKTAEGAIFSEHPIKKSNKRSGRVDILVDPKEDMVAVVEIKNSDWDRMKEKNVRRNIKRQARQVWIYIESQLNISKDVSPGIIFSKRPKTSGRLEYIEKLFGEEGIPVVWQDETIKELKNRKNREE